MKLSKSQKIYLSVLGVGLCALVLDRTLGNSGWTGPAQGKAAPTPMSDVQSRQKQSVTARAAGAISETNIATRLIALRTLLGGPSEIRDAFMPSPAWIATQESTHAAPSERALKFQNSHILKAIVKSPDGDRAWVDNNLLSVGQSIDGFRLTGVGRMRATFTDGIADTDLRLHTEDSGAEQPLQSQ